MKKDVSLIADQEISFINTCLPCHIDINNCSLAVTFDLQPLFVLNPSIYWESLTQQELGSKSQDLKKKRKHELWKTTCLEVFICPKDKSRTDYIELNVAPCGNWNVYYFNAYRIPQLPSEAAIDIHLFSVTKPIQSYYQRKIHLDLRELKQFFSQQLVSKEEITEWKVNITAVVKSANDNSTFFAMYHATPADFHDKDYWFTI